MKFGDMFKDSLMINKKKKHLKWPSLDCGRRERLKEH